MTRARIGIIHSATWGEMGNQLAAGALARQLERLGTVTVVMEAVEALVPLFGAIGREIKDLSASSATPVERARRYMELMAHLGHVFPPEMEEGTGGPDVRNLAAWCKAKRIDVAIGTKGVISRMLLAARRGIDAPMAVVNHITNHGLLTLPIHLALGADLHMTQFPEAESALAAHGVPPQNVVCLGAFSAAEDLAAALSVPGERAVSPLAERPTRFVVLSNRGGETFLRFVRLLARAPEASEIDLLFIDAVDPDAVATVVAIAYDADLPWRAVGKLKQSDYLAELAHLGAAVTPVLVCKPGPNTVMEAVRIAVPCLVLDSGLPMEAWINRFVVDEAIGNAADTPEALCDIARRLVLSGWPSGWQSRLADVRRRLFVPQRTAGRLSEAVWRALELRTSVRVGADG